MSKKILIITDNLPEQVNGVVTTFRNIEIYAANDGYTVEYLCPSIFRHISCPGYSDIKLALPWRIGKKIKDINPDYIHIATEGPIGLAANLWCWGNGWKFNTSYHTKFPEFLKKIYNIPESWTYAYLRWFHKHSGKVLTNTKTMVKELYDNKFTGQIIPWTRGVDRTIFDSSIRNKTDNTVVLLSVGRVSKEKGLEDFCKLDFPKAKKIVVGDGPYRKELEKLYPDVAFVGIKTGKELAQYYADSDVFVFTSRSDTFGIVIIEALAMGTPVAAYPVPGPLDILANGVTGHMSDNLENSIKICLRLKRSRVESASMKWTWKECWKVFKYNLIEK